MKTIWKQFVPITDNPSIPMPHGAQVGWSCWASVETEDEKRSSICGERHNSKAAAQAHCKKLNAKKNKEAVKKLTKVQRRVLEILRDATHEMTARELRATTQVLLRLARNGLVLVFCGGGWSLAGHFRISDKGRAALEAK